MISMQLLRYCHRLSYLTSLSRGFPLGMQDASPAKRQGAGRHDNHRLPIAIALWTGCRAEPRRPSNR